MIIDPQLIDLLEKAYQHFSQTSSTIPEKVQAQLYVPLCNYRGRDGNQILILWDYFKPGSTWTNYAGRDGEDLGAAIFQKLDALKKEIEANEGKSFFYHRKFDKYWGAGPAADWGAFNQFFETDYIGNIIRQVQLFENGHVLKYDRTNQGDEFGQIGDMPLYREGWRKYKVPQKEFMNAWQGPAWNEKSG